jgi:hypothetical protein
MLADFRYGDCKRASSHRDGKTFTHVGGKEWLSKQVTGQSMETIEHDLLNFRHFWIVNIVAIAHLQDTPLIL